jgi:hypothetical protein
MSNPTSATRAHAAIPTDAGDLIEPSIVSAKGATCSSMRASTASTQSQ